MPSDGPDAAVFDLDGVVTFTARVHAAAWQQLFDAYLQARAQRFGGHYVPFDPEGDYRAFVDGKPRYDGVRSFLASRGVRLDEGTPGDPPERETVCGLGNRKNDLFNARVHELGVDVDWECVRFIRELRQRGVKAGLASSSRNAVPILERVDLLDLFDAVVDGLVSERLHLRGKPQPDIFLHCLRELPGTHEPTRAMVVEDAISGVQAGRAGGFGLVLGVDRHNDAPALLEHGATCVVREFREISADKVEEFFRARARVA
jgi:alpha,alpha-trehalase